MILLTLLNIMYSIMSFVAEAVFPALPQAVQSIITYVIQMIQNGFAILDAWFFDFSFVGPLCAFVLDLWLTLMAVDLMWKVIGYIKLSRKN